MRRIRSRDGSSVCIRAIRPEDAKIEDDFVRGLSPKSKYYRFMSSLHELTPEMLQRFTRIDPAREMALIATTEGVGGEVEIAVGRFAMLDETKCEFALVVADAWQGRGIGSAIMSDLIDGARDRGLRVIEGSVLHENTGMLRLMRRLGFTTATDPDDPTVCIVKKQL